MNTLFCRPPLTDLKVSASLRIRQRAAMPSRDDQPQSQARLIREALSVSHHGHLLRTVHLSDSPLQTGMTTLLNMPQTVSRISECMLL